jgi:hypothetical protein
MTFDESECRKTESETLPDRCSVEKVFQLPQNSFCHTSITHTTTNLPNVSISPEILIKLLLNIFRGQKNPPNPLSEKSTLLEKKNALN